MATDSAVSLRAPLAVPAFRRAFIGRTLSGMGSWMQTIAAGWLIYDLTHSAVAVGILAFLARGLGIPFSVTGGQLADRWGAKRLEIWLSLVQLLGAGALAVATVIHDVTPLEVYIATGLVGIGSSLGTAGMQALVIEVVPPEMRKSANALGGLAYNASRLVGPALGGVILATAGAGVCFAINALSFLAIVIALAGLHEAHVPSRGSLITSLTVVRKAPGIGELALLVVAFMTLVTPLQELAPVIAKRHGDGAHLVGFLVSALAAGGITGAWVRQRIDRTNPSVERVLDGVLVVSGLAVAALAITGAYAIAILSMFIAGILWEILFVEGLSATEERVGEHEAVACGVFFAVAAAGVTAGTLLIGTLIDSIGITEALLACGFVLFGVGIVNDVVHGRRRRVTA